MRVNSLLRKSCGLSAITLVVLLAACSGDKGKAGADGVAGTDCTVTDNDGGTQTISCEDGTTATVDDGLVRLVVVTAEPAGANCAAGGQKVESGVDDNGDGTLQAGEVDTTTYVCSGPNGLESLVVVTAEPAGANCTDGGNKIESGIDDNSDGTLQAGEVDDTAYVCDGDDGIDGIDGIDANTEFSGVELKDLTVSDIEVTNDAGAISVTFHVEDDGDAFTKFGIYDQSIRAYIASHVPAGRTTTTEFTCPTGGQKIESGIDTNDDGTLQGSEVEDHAYACNALTGGLMGLVAVTVEAAGANCTDGGNKIESGIDDNDDDTLQAGEVDDTAYACNDGSDLSLVVVGVEPAPVTTWDTPFLERWAYQRNRDRDGDFALDISDAANGFYGFTLNATTASFTALAAGTTNAVDYVADDTQRLLLRVDGRDFGYNRTIGLLDFVVPADGGSTTGLASLERVIIDRTACQSCHNNPLEEAAHGGGYQSPQACNICHTPIGDQYGDEMQLGGAWSANLFHKLHSAIDMRAFPTRIDGTGYGAVRFPGDVKDCLSCHVDKGQDLATNWKTNPTMQICSSCHTTVTFDATAYTQLNGDTHTHTAAMTDNSTCNICHTGTGAAPAGGFTMDIVTAHAPEVRTISAMITDAEVDAGTGNVTVFFSVADGATPVTVQADFDNSMAFTLARLEKGTGGASDHWVSYTARFRTKDPVQIPVLQGYSESSADGTFANLGGGDWSHTFGLLNASTPGDITSNMVTAVNATDGIGGIYEPPTGSVPGTGPTTYPNLVIYDASLTHRVGIEFRDAAGVRNVTNATYDFVPDGTTSLETREIVTIAKCNNCHGGTRLHKGYAVEYCVTCHNQSTFDPFSGDDPVTVGLQTIVHKLHMGQELPSVQAGGEYAINGTHDYSNLALPQSAGNCLMCHDDGNEDGENWTDNPTRRACGTCHDSSASLAHLAANTFDPTPDDQMSGDEAESCTVCHASDKVMPVADAHYGVSQ